MGRENVEKKAFLEHLLFGSHFSCISIEQNFKFIEILVPREILNKSSELNIYYFKVINSYFYIK